MYPPIFSYWLMIKSPVYSSSSIMATTFHCTVQWFQWYCSQCHLTRTQMRLVSRRLRLRWRKNQCMYAAVCRERTCTYRGIHRKSAVALSMDYRRPIKPFFIEIQNFSWVDQFSGIWGIFCQHPFWYSASLVHVFLYSTMAFYKNQPIYPHPKYLFGIGI